MDNNVSNLSDPPPRGVTRRMTLLDHLVGLIERHGDDYVIEGKRLLRRIVRTVTIVGVLLVVLTGSLIALVVHALLR
jgi:hypothetical protein